jgi:hypothetical protein
MTEVSCIIANCTFNINQYRITDQTFNIFKSTNRIPFTILPLNFID